MGAIPTIVLVGLAVLSFGIVVWQFLAARRFPLHQRVADLRDAPGITLLKPLKGCDPHTLECLESWMWQVYAGPVQVLFLVQDPADPVCELVRGLLARHPSRDARLCVFPEPVGVNAKVSKLAQAESWVKHDLILVSDADVRVPSDLLANLVVPLRDPAVGLVNGFYRLANPVTAAMRWEAVAANADFWSQVLQARMLAPMDFGLGAAMLVRRKALEQIGGFRSLADHLADDFQLGHRLAKAGWKVELSPVVVECLDAPSGWAAVWAHQVRWNRTIRVCRPAPYAASILSNGTLWPLLAAVAVWFTAAIPDPWAFRLLGLFAFFLLARSWMARSLAARLAAIPGRPSSNEGWVLAMAVPRDLLGVAVWAAALFGNQVVWRGLRYRVGSDGRLTRER
jgi:ceramide glucosyltransferase